MLDTGGSVYQGGKIVGVVSGRGAASGLVYIARMDLVRTWVQKQIAFVPTTKSAPMPAGKPMPMPDGGADGGDASMPMPKAPMAMPKAIPRPADGGT